MKRLSCGAILVVILAACGSSTAPSTLATESTSLTTHTAASPSSQASAEQLPAVAMVSEDGTVAVIRDGESSRPITGIVGADERTLISTSASGAATTVSWSVLETGAQTASVAVDGDLQAIATDITGKFVALKPRARSMGTTELVVASPAGERFRKQYSAELVPEGFSNAYTDSLPIGMFVLEYLDPPPPTPPQTSTDPAPRRYQVRVLDLITGELGLPLNLRDKSQSVDEQMLGSRRSHIASPDNGLLFTLYRGVNDDESNYAFVHTLGFFNGVWCLDLPPELELQHLPGAMTLANDETSLLVASSNGNVSEFVISDITDSERDPLPRRTYRAWHGRAGEAGPTMASFGNQVAVGQGHTLRWIDITTLQQTASFDWDMDIEAVAMLDNGDVLAVGTGRISQITSAGALIAELPLPAGLGTVDHLVVLNR